MGLTLALAWTPKFRCQVLHIVEEKEKLSLQHDAETVKTFQSPITLMDAIRFYNDEFDLPDDMSVVIETSIVEEVFSVQSFETYLAMREAPLDIEFRGGETEVEDPYPLEYQEDEANAFEHQEPPEESPWDPPC